MIVNEKRMVSLARIMVGVVTSIVFLCPAIGGPNTATVMKICATRTFEENGSFDSCRHSTFNDIFLQTTSHGYSYMKDCNTNGELSGKFYGHGACNGGLSPLNCTVCLLNAMRDMVSACIHSIGPRLKLVDCRVRYEDYQFDPNY
ncbi:hypothetical protein MLD38_029711 [Melastoma candidum]|uniref:Uncharacterized protein n=1 Tax=Melastoma candidum TaxID=119954 RepID=A0ACB9N6B5_9MYRT|nr:hypothetical protein MLD38_029711 [Melastoma candidum]